jgi:hypothetical protein
MRVGFDLDGCLYDFGNSVRRYLDSIGRVYGFKDNKPEPHHWDFYEYWNMSRQEFVGICNDGVDAGFIFSGPARPGAVEAVAKVAKEGHQIIIVTDRNFGANPSMSHNATSQWLTQHGIEYDELWFSADKTIGNADVFVEDKLSNYDALVNAGTPTALITRDWNIDPELGIADGRWRINDISEYPQFVNEISLTHEVLAR